MLHSHIDDNTYQLTPRSRVLLQKLTGFAASQEIPRIYGTRKFITVLTSARINDIKRWKSSRTLRRPLLIVEYSPQVTNCTQ
jgi:hypothetical protein